MQQNGELSVEEILESIKKVIARDNKEVAQVERHRRETEGVVLRGPGSTFGLTAMTATDNDDDLDDESHEESAEVLDLGEAAAPILPEDTGRSPAPELVLVADDEEAGLELTDALPPEEAPETESLDTESSETDSPEPQAQEPEESPSAQPLESLAAMPETPATDSPDTGSESPLERMVRESLRPMLREWLDTNLPPIVERMVKDELGRIMGKLT